MPSLKLTLRSVEAAVPKIRDTFLWDNELRGFGLKVTPKGTKTYVVQYRMGGRDSPTRRFNIGRHGVWTPMAARTEAERLLRQAATGTDPQAAAKAREELERDLGFADFAARFLREYGQREWRPRTLKSAMSNMERWIIPVLGRKPLPTIVRRDITAVFDRVPSTKPALPRNLFALLRKLFAWAEDRGDVERSPMRGMKSPPAVMSRDRVLSDREVTYVAGCADQLGKPFGQFIRMLVVTGQRRDEVAGMTWAEVDRTMALWTIPPSRSKNKREHSMPLNEIAVRELDNLAGGRQWPKKGLVFTTTGTTPVSGYSRMKRRLDQILETAHRQPIAPWRLHDLRRTFATNMQRMGVRFEVTEALLNHISGSKAGVAGIYQRHDWVPEKREAVDAWATRLQELVAEQLEPKSSRP